MRRQTKQKIRRKIEILTRMICSATGIIDGASLRIPWSRTTARYARVADRQLKKIKINFQILLKFIFSFFCYCKHWNVTANQMILLICMGEWETFVMFSILACIAIHISDISDHNFNFSCQSTSSCSAQRSHEMPRREGWNSFCTTEDWSWNDSSSSCPRKLCRTHSFCQHSRYLHQHVDVLRWNRIFHLQSIRCASSRMSWPIRVPRHASVSALTAALSRSRVYIEESGGYLIVYRVVLKVTKWNDFFCDEL